MKMDLKRREFIHRVSLAAISATLLGGCGNKEEQASKESSEHSDDSKSAENLNDSGAAPATFQKELDNNRKLPRELVMKLLDQKVNQYMQLSHHCAQSSFLALQEQFGLEGDEIVKALTPLTGIAERGETCGAVTGPLMAFGLIYGRGKGRLSDWETYRESLVPSGEFCTRFEEEYGSTMCHDIQQVKFGKCFRLTDPDELQEFQEADATEHCSAVVRTAVRIAAEIILDEESL